VRTITDLSPRHLFPYINEVALFRGQWGFKQGKLSPEEFERLTDEKARPVFDDLKRRALEEGFLEPKVVYGYFPIQSTGDALIVYHPDEFAACPCGAHGAASGVRPATKPREYLRFTFPRQQGRRRLCISDFFRPVESGEFDVLGVQLVTVGDKATQLAEQLRRDNRYQDYLYLHGFGVESAEALAELWHKRMRQELGFGSEDAPSVRELFQQHYRGSRYSFGYPACPNLEDRATIAMLLKPEAIGVRLTENFMLDPEQSTDALVVHHPQAKYFDV
jgi:5-methyltetrahydrofolate--homocysteine methyltransferase